MDLRDLFTVAQFIKIRCEHGLKAGATDTKDKNYVFFEVEILDTKSKAQLCYLDKVCVFALSSVVLIFICYYSIYYYLDFFFNVV